jgi:hypothetical protein
MNAQFFRPPYCSANCGQRTINESGICGTCLDRMAVLKNLPEQAPPAPPRLVEMRPKRLIRCED